MESDGGTDDEAYVVREPAVLVPAAAQLPAGQPLVLEVDESGRMVLPASLPLVMVTNARSLYNKVDNLIKWLLEIFPDCAIISETWEYEGRGLPWRTSWLIPPTKYTVIGGPRGGQVDVVQ